MQLTCNNCNKDFWLDRIRNRPVKNRSGVERVYFICPHCKCEFTSYYTNKSIKRKQQLVRDLLNKRRKAFDTNDTKRAQELTEKVKELQAKMKQEMDTLRTSIEDDDTAPK